MQPSSTWRESARKDGKGVFTRACRDRTGRNGFKPRQCRFRLGIRRMPFAVSMVRYQNRFPRKIVDAPPVDVSKDRLDGTLSNLE